MTITSRQQKGELNNSFNLDIYPNTPEGPGWRDGIPKQNATYKQVTIKTILIIIET